MRLSGVKGSLLIKLPLREGGKCWVHFQGVTTHCLLLVNLPCAIQQGKNVTVHFHVGMIYLVSNIIVY